MGGREMVGQMKPWAGHSSSVADTTEICPDRSEHACLTVTAEPAQSARALHGGMCDDNALPGVLHMRLAAEPDFPALWRLYGDACEEMAGTPHDCEWVMGVHPTREDLLGAIQAGQLHVACGVEITGPTPLLGAFVLNGEQTSGYERAAWPIDAAPAEVAVIHLLGTAPRARGRGVARAMLTHAARLARAQGARVIRLDVFANNAPALALYRSFGFVDIGPHELLLSEGHVRTLNLMELDLASVAE